MSLKMKETPNEKSNIQNIWNTSGYSRTRCIRTSPSLTFNRTIEGILVNDVSLTKYARTSKLDSEDRGISFKVSSLEDARLWLKERRKKKVKRKKERRNDRTKLHRFCIRARSGWNIVRLREESMVKATRNADRRVSPAKRWKDVILTRVTYCKYNSINPPLTIRHEVTFVNWSRYKKYYCELNIIIIIDYHRYRYYYHRIVAITRHYRLYLTRGGYCIEGGTARRHNPTNGVRRRRNELIVRERAHVRVNQRKGTTVESQTRGIEMRKTEKLKNGEQKEINNGSVDKK